MSVAKARVLRSLCRYGCNLGTRLYSRRVYPVSKECWQLRSFRPPGRMCVCCYSTVPETKQFGLDEETRTTREMIRSFFESSIHYNNTIVNLNMARPHISDEKAEELLKKDWSTKPVPELFEAIRLLSYNAVTSKTEDGKSYGNILYALDVAVSQAKGKLAYKDLLTLLKHLIILHPRIKNYAEYRCFTNNLNKYSHVLLYPVPPIDELLLLGDTLCHLSMERTNLMMEVLRRIGRKTYKLTTKQLVQFCSLISMAGSMDINMYEIEYAVEQSLDDITDKELGIICLGFFKSKSKFRSADFIRRILQRLIERLDTIDKHTLTSILKMLRYSIPLEIKSLVSTLVERLIPRIPSLPLMTITHIAHATSNFGIVNENVYKAIVIELEKNLDLARLKDFDRILTALSMMHECHKESSIYHTVTRHLLKRYNDDDPREVSMYPLCYGRVLTCLAYQNIYAPALINRMMDPNMVNKVCLKIPRWTPYDYWYMHHSVKLDYPEYSQRLLTPNLYDYVMQKVAEDPGANKRQTQMGGLICEIAEICKDYFSSTAVYVDKLLPQYTTPTIVIGFDKDNNFLNAEEILSAMPDFSFKHVNTDELKGTRWIAIHPIYNASTSEIGDFLLGNMIAFARHLQLLGYSTAWITSRTVEALRNKEQRQSTMENILNTVQRPDVQKIMESRKIIVE